MENDEIIEGNKLIAEFMGGKFRKSKDKNTLNKYFDLKDKGYFYYENEICYHASWDWIMPVVEKIESDGFIVHIEQEICYIRNKTNSTENIVYNCQHPKIESVYKSVVEFIKWYNQNTK